VAQVATLYDIHGNLAALEAVLAEVPDDATIVVGGDVVAGGEDPAGTLEHLRGFAIDEGIHLDIGREPLERGKYRGREKHVAMVPQLDHQGAANLSQVDGV